MPLPSDHDLVVVIGPRDSGKSTLIDAILFNEARVIATDSSAGIALSRLAPADARQEWLDHLSRPGPVRVLVDATQDPALALETACAYSVRAGDVERIVAIHDELGDALEGAVDPRTLADRFPNFAFEVRQGRHHSVKVVCGFQRAAEVPRTVTANAQDWYVFEGWEPRDEEYIRAVTKGRSGLPPLARFEAAHVRKGRVFGIAKVDVRTRTINERVLIAPDPQL